jgi:hypothetical protein
MFFLSLPVFAATPPRRQQQITPVYPPRWWLPRGYPPHQDRAPASFLGFDAILYGSKNVLEFGR